MEVTMKVIVVLTAAGDYRCYPSHKCAACGMELKQTERWVPDEGPVYEHPVTHGIIFRERLGCQYAGASAVVPDLVIQARVL
jgi:hypothetical protein